MNPKFKGPFYYKTLPIYRDNNKAYENLATIYVICMTSIFI